jgi:hypothetical protein
VDCGQHDCCGLSTHDQARHDARQPAAITQKIAYLDDCLRLRSPEKMSNVERTASSS